MLLRHDHQAHQSIDESDHHRLRLGASSNYKSSLIANILHQIQTDIKELAKTYAYFFSISNQSMLLLKVKLINNACNNHD